MTNGERVAAGAALLDERFPNWHREIDCATLDIRSGCRCILGQLYGYYGDGLNKLNITSRSSLFGFAVSDNGIDELNECWREEIAKRRMLEIPKETEVGVEAYC